MPAIIYVFALKIVGRAAEPLKLTEIAEPLDELGGNASVELLNLNVENGEHAAALLLADFA